MFEKRLNELITSSAINEKNKIWCCGKSDGIVEFFCKGVKNSSTLPIGIGSIRSVSYDREGSNVLVGDKDANIYIVNSETMEVSYSTQKTHKSSLEVASYLSDNLFVTGDCDGYIRVWDIRDNKAARKYRDVRECVVGISPVDEYNFGVAHDNGVLSYYTTKKDKRKQYYHQEDDDFSSVCFDKFREVFLCASSKPRLYAAKNMSLDFEFETSLRTNSPFVSVRTLDTVTTRIGVGCQDGKIIISDVGPTKIIYCFQAHRKILSGFEADRSLCLTWDSDGFLRVWDLEPVRTLEFVSQRKKKRMKKKGKKIVSLRKNDHFFDDLLEDDAEYSF